MVSREGVAIHRGRQGSGKLVVLCSAVNFCACCFLNGPSVLVSDLSLEVSHHRHIRVQTNKRRNRLQDEAPRRSFRQAQSQTRAVTSKKAVHSNLPVINQTLALPPSPSLPSDSRAYAYEISYRLKTYLAGCLDNEESISPRVSRSRWPTLATHFPRQAPSFTNVDPSNYSTFSIAPSAILPPYRAVILITFLGKACAS